MLSATYGVAGGALLPTQEGRRVEATFFVTNDGQTWSQQGSTIAGFVPMDISVIDDSNAFAAGITEVGLSSLARWAVQIPEEL